MFKHGRYSKETRERGQALRDLAKAMDVFGSTVLTKAGLRPVKALRRKVHVRRALAEIEQKKALAEAEAAAKEAEVKEAEPK